jgi:SAM-dependent methyltransferase
VADSDAKTDRAGLAPGVPTDYYDRIYAAEEEHWWYRGMRSITRAMLGDELLRSGLRLLDAGCGTGGFLRWALDFGDVRAVCGVDVSSAAVELARERVPEARFDVAPLWQLPYEPASFDLVTLNDVLQHIPEDKVAPSLMELGRVLVQGGALFLRTNGALRARRERDDWRAYDARSLGEQLAAAGFRVGKLSYANMIPSLWAAVTGSSPRAPTEERHGIPIERSSNVRGAVGLLLLEAEGRFMRKTNRSLPFGHTIVAVARTGDLPFN